EVDDPGTPRQRDTEKDSRISQCLTASVCRSRARLVCSFGYAIVRRPIDYSPLAPVHRRCAGGLRADAAGGPFGRDAGVADPAAVGSVVCRAARVRLAPSQFAGGAHTPPRARA